MKYSVKSVMKFLLRNQKTPSLNTTFKKVKEEKHKSQICEQLKY